MKDEIKEILEWLNDKDYYIEDFGYKFKRLSLEENEALLDYITNLQTIEQQYSAILSENAELENKITNLQDRTDEAIEYIKEKSEEVELNFYGFPDKITSFKGSVSTLLKILKGKSDE